MIKLNKGIKDFFIELKNKKVFLEGSVLKVLSDDNTDTEIKEYLDFCKQRDIETRKKRLEITRQVQTQNTDLLNAQSENEKLMEELKEALQEAEKSKDLALNDLEVMQKKSQFELVGIIIKYTLWIIIGVGGITSIMYLFAIIYEKDTQIIGSAWSNLFGILLTNAFSIVGTIMGVKYATEKSGK